MNETSSLAQHLRDGLRRDAEEITRGWLDMLCERLQLDEHRALPTGRLLDHVPEIIEGVADVLVEPDRMLLEQVVIDDLFELARLRRNQGFDVQEILEEFELLTRIVADRMEEDLTTYPGTVDPQESARIFGRLNRAMGMLSTVTARFYRKEDLEERRKRADLMGTFGKTLSHELKNRLGAGKTAVQLLLEEGKPISAADVRKLLEAVDRSISRALQAVDDVRALALSHGGESLFEGRHVLLGPLVDDVLESMHSMAAERGVALSRTPDFPDAMVDGTRVQIILMNLVSNAIKYCNAEGPEAWVRVGARPVLETTHPLWEVSIEDNGVGISPASQKRVFERFYRDPSVLAKDGTGLGLAIVSQAVEQLGGHVRVESEPGRGSTFSFTVPMESTDWPEGAGPF